MLLLLTLLTIVTALPTGCQRYEVGPCLITKQDDLYRISSHKHQCEFLSKDILPKYAENCYFIHNSIFTGTPLSPGCNLYLDCYKDMKLAMLSYIVIGVVLVILVLVLS
jgi:hypothetical protein